MNDVKADQTSLDKAGREYWNKSWDVQSLPRVWDIKTNGLGNYVERAFFKSLSGAINATGLDGAGASLVEVGCARSQVLPVLAKELGLRVFGIDYSENGCEQARMILRRENVAGEIHCHDVFSLSDHLVGQFDIVISFGLIEHFKDTNEIVAALSRLVKPGGLVFTNLPNMNGVTGMGQRLANRDIYDIHVPLTPEEVRKAHENAGLAVLACNYFLSTNFGVLNLGEAKASAAWWFRKIVLAVLARLSMGVWLAERFGLRLPVSRLFSPYINCVATKPVQSDQ